MKPKKSDKPFRNALKQLMSENDLTYRELSGRTEAIDGKGITHAHLNMIANGHDRPSLRVMELVAAAVGVQPDYFAEYRMAKAADELDPNTVGFEQALKNLNARRSR